jgi:predicted nucleic acid-binding protein
MQVIVSDSSCVIDLRKVSLLDVLLRLPYEFLIPNTLFVEELLQFTPQQKRSLIRAGLKVIDLPGERVLRAQEVVRQDPKLSVHDGFAFALAEDHSGSILLTGDGDLRALAEAHQIEVHGVLWVIDELYRCGVTSVEILCEALTLFSTDTTMRLPRRDVMAYLKRYEKLK